MEHVVQSEDGDVPSADGRTGTRNADEDSASALASNGTHKEVWSPTASVVMGDKPRGQPGVQEGFASFCLLQPNISPWIASFPALRLLVLLHTIMMRFFSRSAASSEHLHFLRLAFAHTVQSRPPSPLLSPSSSSPHPLGYANSTTQPFGCSFLLLPCTASQQALNNPPQATDVPCDPPPILIQEHIPGLSSSPYVKDGGIKPQTHRGSVSVSLLNQKTEQTTTFFRPSPIPNRQL